MICLTSTYSAEQPGTAAVTLCASPNRLGGRSEVTECEIRLVGNGEGYAMLPKRQKKSHFFLQIAFFPHILWCCKPFCFAPSGILIIQINLEVWILRDIPACSQILQEKAP